MFQQPSTPDLEPYPLHPTEQARAHRIRRALLDEDAYPTAPGNARWPAALAEARQELPPLLTRLGDADLQALWDLAWLFHCVPPDPCLPAYAALTRA